MQELADLGTVVHGDRRYGAAGAVWDALSVHVSAETPSPSAECGFAEATLPTSDGAVSTASFRRS